MKKVALVYDWVDSWGGVERVLMILHRLFPEAPLYTSHWIPETAPWSRDLSVIPSFLQHFPKVIRKSRTLSTPFYPFAFESFRFDNYDAVISVTSSFAKGILTRPETRHISYILTPPRFLWTHRKMYASTPIKRLITAPVAAWLRSWDYIAAQRPDTIFTISEHVARRVNRYYGRTSEVLYPPFDTDYWHQIKMEISRKNKPAILQKLPLHYLLVVSRLEPYKNVSLAIRGAQAFGKYPLVIVGKGSKKQELMQKAGRHVFFLETVSDEELAFLYSHAVALIMPQEEDFGYVALEAQFFGCPVIAYGIGGAGETVQKHNGSVFFMEQTVSAVRSALEKHHTISYNIRRKGMGSGYEAVKPFALSEFESRMRSAVTG